LTFSFDLFIEGREKAFSRQKMFRFSDAKAADAR